MAYFYHLEDGRQAISRCLPMNILESEKTELQILENTVEAQNAAYASVGILVLEAIMLIVTFVLMCARYLRRSTSSNPQLGCDRSSRAIDIDLTMLEG